MGPRAPRLSFPICDARPTSPTSGWTGEPSVSLGKWRLTDARLSLPDVAHRGSSICHGIGVRPVSSRVLASCPLFCWKALVPGRPSWGPRGPCLFLVLSGALPLAKKREARRWGLIWTERPRPPTAVAQISSASSGARWQPGRAQPWAEPGSRPDGRRRSARPPLSLRSRAASDYE